MRARKGSRMDYATASPTVICRACGEPSLRRLAGTALPLCAECYGNVGRARRQLEREGVLPPHRLGDVEALCDRRVLARCRELKAKVPA